ncbi:MAG TPA: chorismate-binding protein, partial [Gaiellaceae bacterium]|nr:chorismate-binding protein [Gaiellaceae bacterium]
MTTTAIDTDLVTPLGAYLQLRERGRASFLLESVEKGRLGRYSLVGCGDRMVSFEEAETLREPVVGYLGYDHVAKLEPTVPLPETRPDVPESRFVVPDVLLRFDHARNVAEVLAGPADLSFGERPPAPASASSAQGETRRYPDAEAYMAGVERAKEHIRKGDAFQIVLSQRAVRPTAVSAVELYRALRRINPSPYLFLL